MRTWIGRYTTSMLWKSTIWKVFPFWEIWWSTFACSHDTFVSTFLQTLLPKASYLMFQVKVPLGNLEYSVSGWKSSLTSPQSLGRYLWMCGYKATCVSLSGNAVVLCLWRFQNEIVSDFTVCEMTFFGNRPLESSHLHLHHNKKVSSHQQTVELLL